MTIELFLMRHGESARDHGIIGGGDAPLTDRGKQQVHDLAVAWAANGFSLDEIWSSPLLRARTSAEELCGTLGLDPRHIRYDPRLRELWAGDWEGLLKSRILTPAVLAKQDAQGMRYRYLNGESMNDVADRVVDDWLAEQLVRWNDGVKILVVFHGQAIRSTLGRLFGVDERLAWLLPEGDNASVTKLRRVDASWRLVYANRVPRIEF